MLRIANFWFSVFSFGINYLAKDSEKCTAKIFEDVDMFTAQDCNKKIQNFKGSANIKTQEIFSSQHSQNTSFHQIMIKY